VQVYVVGIWIRIRNQVSLNRRLATVVLVIVSISQFASEGWVGGCDTLVYWSLLTPGLVIRVFGSGEDEYEHWFDGTLVQLSDGNVPVLGTYLTIWSSV
jgi:hypothetical protein